MVVRFGSVHTDWSSWVETTEVVSPDLTLDSGKFRMGCGGYVFRRAGNLAMLVVRFDSDQPHGPSPDRRAYGHGCARTDTGRQAPPQRGPRATAAAAGPGARYGWWVRRVSDSRLIRPNSDYPFWAPNFEGHRNPMRVPPDFGFRPIQISTFSTTWLWTCE